LAIVTALWENGKGFTNGHLEGDQYYTTVNWFGIDIATYTYTIKSDGKIFFSMQGWLPPNERAFGSHQTTRHDFLNNLQAA
jgi:hypothetical protein